MVEDGSDGVGCVEELIETLCDKYLRQLLAEDRVHRRSEQDSDNAGYGLIEAAEAYAEDFYQERVEVVAEAAQALLAAEGVDLAGPQLRGLLEELLQARVVAIKAALKERAEDGRFDPRSIQLRRSSSSAAPDVAAAHTVGELAESYVKHQRETESWKRGPGLTAAQGFVLEWCLWSDLG